jgi:hypothetical protein
LTVVLNEKPLKQFSGFFHARRQYGLPMTNSHPYHFDEDDEKNPCKTEAKLYDLARKP